MDSKKLKPEKIKELNEKNRKNALAFHVVTFTPRRFNQFLEEVRGEEKSLNDILAWGHTKAIDKVYNETTANSNRRSHLRVPSSSIRLHKTPEIRGGPREADIGKDAPRKIHQRLDGASARPLRTGFFMTWAEYVDGKDLRVKLKKELRPYLKSH